MGLNSWSLDYQPEPTTLTLESLGLEREQEQEQNRAPEPENKPGAPEAVVNVDLTQPQPTERTLADSELAQIPQWAVKVNLIEEKGNKVVDMLDVQKDIEGDELMSQPRAEAINATFENFLTSGNSLNGFTKTDSRVRLDSTKRFMSEKIKTTLESLTQDVEEYKVTYAPELKTATQSLNSNGIYDSFCAVREACKHISENEPKFEGRTLIFPLEGEQFFNVLTESLMTLDVAKINERIPFKPEARRALEEIQSLWSSSPFLRSICGLVTAAHTFGAVDLGNKSVNGDTLGPAELTVQNILLFFAADRADHMYDALSRYTEDLIGKVDVSIDKLQAKNPDPYQQANMIVTQAKEVSDASAEVLKATSLARDISKFASVCCIFIDAIANM